MRKVWKFLLRVVSAVTILEFLLFLAFSSAKFVFLPTLFTLWMLPYIHTHWPAHESEIVSVFIVLYAGFILTGFVLFSRMAIQKYRTWRKRRNA